MIVASNADTNATAASMPKLASSGFGERWAILIYG
jgi:hypothetical protein